MAIVYPVIVVPAITGTYLTDEHPLPPETVWNDPHVRAHATRIVPLGGAPRAGACGTCGTA
jgi:hypothetical protein